MIEIKKGWHHPIGKELLSGLVVCMALMPEVIGFSIVAGVDPMVGVYSSFCISVITALFGGTPGMISAAAGAMALVLASLVKEYGVQYMLAATILTGIIQMLLGLFKIGRLMKYIPKPVMIGFVNALGIMMFKAQVEHFQGAPILIILAILGIGIIYLFPRINKNIPSPIVAIIAITGIVMIGGFDIKTLGDMGNITNQLPKFLMPSVPFNLETFTIILPYAISLSLVGLVESLLTSQLLDDMIDTKSDKDRECMGQGLGNVVAGCFGGIAGCGMIGQSITNHTYGGRGRLSTLMSGTFMMLFVILFNKVVIQIPVVALAAVMVVVSITTFNWQSIKRMKKVPKTDTAVMLVTVLVVLITHNLAYGVVIGILLSAIFFVVKISEIHVEQVVDNEVNYLVKGQLFFASTEKFIESFDYETQVKEVKIDLSQTKLWDESAVAAIDKVVLKFHKNGTSVQLIGASKNCHKLLEEVALHNKEGGLEALSAH